MVAMLGDVNKSIEIDQNTWTNVHAKYATPYKSKTLAEQSAWNSSTIKKVKTNLKW